MQLLCLKNKTKLNFENAPSIVLTPSLPRSDIRAYLEVFQLGIDHNLFITDTLFFSCQNLKIEKSFPITRSANLASLSPSCIIPALFLFCFLETPQTFLTPFTSSF